MVVDFTASITIFKVKFSRLPKLMKDSRGNVSIVISAVILRVATKPVSFISRPEDERRDGSRNIGGRNYYDIVPDCYVCERLFAKIKLSARCTRF